MYLLIAVYLYLLGNSGLLMWMEILNNLGKGFM